MTHIPYQKGHADKTLTSRQQVENELSKVSSTVSKALNGRFTGPIIKNMPLSVGIAIAAGYMHMQTGMPFTMPFKRTPILQNQLARGLLEMQ